MIKVTICGACGRMGTRIAQLAVMDPELQVAALLEAKGHPAVKQDVGFDLGLKERLQVTDDAEQAIEAGDVVVDFTSPVATLNHLKIAHEKGKAIVIGTTGLDKSHLEEMRECSRTIPILYAPNMSLGVSILSDLVGRVAEVLGRDYDIEIVEAHHRFKKDAPSGTALRLAEIIAERTGRKLSDVATHGREGMVGERQRDEIGIHAVRGGDIVGEHTVMFVGLGERLELTHRAHSRDNFALGAIRAVKYIHKKPAGLYDIRDVLGLKK